MFYVTNSVIVKEAIIHIGAMRETLECTLTLCIVRKKCPYVFHASHYFSP